MEAITGYSMDQYGHYYTVDYVPVPPEPKADAVPRWMWAVAGAFSILVTPVPLLILVVVWLCLRPRAKRRYVAQMAQRQAVLNHNHLVYTRLVVDWQRMNVKPVPASESLPVTVDSI